MNWPNNKFLLPAGFLPKPAPVSVFSYYEKLRSGKYFNTPPIASGFEYYFMVDQSPTLVNNSILKGKIAGVHGPWTQMHRSQKLQWRVLEPIVFRPKIANNLFDSAVKTLDFTKTVGGKYIILHTVDLDHKNPTEFLKKIKVKANELGIKIYLEIDNKETRLPNWYYEHLALWRKFKNPIVYDPATVEVNKMNLQSDWESVLKESKGKINNIVAHVHLNEYQPNLDMDQGMMKSARYAKLIKQIKKSHYDGFFTFEIGPAQNMIEKVLTAGYLFSTITKTNHLIPGLEKTYWRKLNNNFNNSIRFTKAALS